MMSGKTETHNTLHIPEKIQQDIIEKWFHLYKWISPDEVKLSIERDFLKILKIIGIPLAVISILVAIPFAGSTMTFLWVFLWAVSIGVALLFIYLLFISLKRSFLLSKSAFVVLTDSSISIWGQVMKLSDVSRKHPHIKEVSSTFEEDLFWDSTLDSTRDSLWKEIMDQLSGWYKFIIKSWDKLWNSGKESEKAVLFLIAVYTLYAVIMSGVYFIGVFFLWIFWNLITKLNTWFLIKRWHTVLKINALFWEVDIASEDITLEKKHLKVFLKDAYDNQWKEWLLTKIHESIENINKTANSAVDSTINLRKTIESSRYQQMFSFPVYHSWIKKQIADPLEQILKLLEKNIEILEKTDEEIQDQISKTEKISNKSALELQLKRIHMQKRDIERFIPLLRKSLEKLKV